MHYLIPDTNIFQHYPPLDHGSWTKHLPSGQVCVVLTPILLRELNEQKDGNRTRRVKRRAAEAIRRIRDWRSRGNIAPNLSVIYAREPQIDFAQHYLSRDINDNHFVASCIALIQEHPTDQITFLTEDAGPQFTAEDCGVLVLLPPANLRIEDELDETEQEVQKLRQQVRDLTSHTPDLTITLSDDCLSSLINLPIDNIAGRVNDYVANVSQRHPKFVIERPSPSGISPIHQYNPIYIDGISNESKMEYNRKLDEYYAQCEQYGYTCSRIEDEKRRTLELTMTLLNNGTAPAYNVTLIIRFSQGFVLRNSLITTEQVEAPTAPAKPLTLAQMRLEPRVDISRYLRDRDETTVMQENVSEARIDNSDEPTAQIEIALVKHGVPERLKPLFITLPSWDADSLSVQCEIHATNMSHPKKQGRTFTVKRNVGKQIVPAS